jgi:hypothetical protein
MQSFLILFVVFLAGGDLGKSEVQKPTHGDKIVADFKRGVHTPILAHDISFEFRRPKIY